MRALTADNDAALAAAGLPRSNANRYIAHFLGSGGAVRFLKAMAAHPDAPAAALMPAIAKANPSIFYEGGGKGEPRSLAEVYELQTRRFGARTAPVTDEADPGHAPAPYYAALPYPARRALYNDGLARRRSGSEAQRASLDTQRARRRAGKPVTADAEPDRATYALAYGDAGEAMYAADMAERGQQGLMRDLAQMGPAERESYRASYQPPPDKADDPAALARAARADTLAARIDRRLRADPVAFARSMDPDLDAQWSDAETTPGQSVIGELTARTRINQQSQGLKPEEIRPLSRAYAGKVVATLLDTSKTVNQRLEPFIATIKAVDDSDTAHTVMRQLILAGAPPMLRATADALMRGDDPAATRIAKAVLDTPSGKPNSAMTPGISTPANEKSVPGRDRDLLSNATERIGSPPDEQFQNLINLSRSTQPSEPDVAPDTENPDRKDERGRDQPRDQLLYSRLTQAFLASNGGDANAARDQAARDVFGTGFASGASVSPETSMDAPNLSGMMPGRRGRTTPVISESLHPPTNARRFGNDTNRLRLAQRDWASRQDRGALFDAGEKAEAKGDMEAANIYFSEFNRRFSEYQQSNYDPLEQDRNRQAIQSQDGSSEYKLLPQSCKVLFGDSVSDNEFKFAHDDFMSAISRLKAASDQSRSAAAEDAGKAAIRYAVCNPDGWQQVSTLIDAAPPRLRPVLQKRLQQTATVLIDDALMRGQVREAAGLAERSGHAAGQYLWFFNNPLSDLIGTRVFDSVQYTITRIEENPDGFEKAAAALDIVPNTIFEILGLREKKRKWDQMVARGGMEAFRLAQAQLDAWGCEAGMTPGSVRIVEGALLLSTLAVMAKSKARGGFREIVHSREFRAVAGRVRGMQQTARNGLRSLAMDIRSPSGGPRLAMAGGPTDGSVPSKPTHALSMTGTSEGGGGGRRPPTDPPESAAEQKIPQRHQTRHASDDINSSQVPRYGLARSQTTEVPIDDLIYTHSVPRAGKPDQYIQSLAKKIKVEGYDIGQAIQVARMPNGRLILLGGNHRLAAMSLLNEKSIPARVIDWSHLSANQRAFYQRKFPEKFLGDE